MKLVYWLRGWYVTLHIKYFEPELYRQLKEPLEGEDYGEVLPPGE